MKLALILSLVVMTNVGFAKAIPSAETTIKKTLVTGVFKGKTHYQKDCTAEIKFKKDASGNTVVVGEINYIGYSGEKSSANVEINLKTDNAYFEFNEYEDGLAELSKSKRTPEPDNDGAELDFIEIIKQYTEEGKVVEMRLEWYVVNEHSDPSEDFVSCVTL